MSVYVSKNPIDIREKISQLDKPIGTAGQSILSANTKKDQQELLGVGKRNLLINSNFQVSQRGDYTNSTSITGTEYYLDRWKTVVSGAASFQHNKNIELPNGEKTNSAKCTVTSSNGYVAIQQWIEDYNIISGKAVTLSFWMRTNIPNMFISLYLGSAGQPRFEIQQDSDATEEWKHYEITIDVTKVNVTAARPEFWSQFQEPGAFFEVSNVQLEASPVATPFEHRSYGEELALCQRYFYTIGGEDVNQFIGTGQCYSSNQVNGITVSPPVELRTKDFTFTVSDILHFKVQNSTGSGQALASITIGTAENSAKIIGLRAVTSGTPLVAGNTTLLYASNTSARLSFDAEF